MSEMTSYVLLVSGCLFVCSPIAVFEFIIRKATKISITIIGRFLSWKYSFGFFFFLFFNWSCMFTMCDFCWHCVPPTAARVSEIACLFA